jgi:flagellar motor protein MotB
MKKHIVFLPIVLAVFCAVTLITACQTPAPPPPPAAQQQQPTPPPPPPPPPEPVVTELPPDTSPPEISVELTPQPYSPISPDGEEQYLTVNIHVKSASPIDTWYIELREPESNRIFVSLEQKGEVPETIIWDGLNDEGEMVESATLYNFTLSVTNIYHDSMIDQAGFIIPEGETVVGQKVNGSTTYQGTLAVDVFVKMEEKGLLRIIVPSIIFASNSGELAKGLAPDIAANNDRILKRIAEVLNYFDTYRVTVEGHANPTFPPNSRQRESEERGTAGILGLQPLSEQRAKAVVEYLVNLGVDRSRLGFIGMGGTRIRTEFADRGNWWKNRRVEFILDKP